MISFKRLASTTVTRASRIVLRAPRTGPSNRLRYPPDSPLQNRYFKRLDALLSGRSLSTQFQIQAQAVASEINIDSRNYLLRPSWRRPSPTSQKVGEELEAISVPAFRLIRGKCIQKCRHFDSFKLNTSGQCWQILANFTNRTVQSFMGFLSTKTSNYSRPISKSNVNRTISVSYASMAKMNIRLSQGRCPWYQVRFGRPMHTIAKQLRPEIPENHLSAKEFYSKEYKRKYPNTPDDLIEQSWRSLPFLSNDGYQRFQQMEDESKVKFLEEFVMYDVDLYASRLKRINLQPDPAVQLLSTLLATNARGYQAFQHMRDDEMLRHKGVLVRYYEGMRKLELEMYYRSDHRGQDLVRPVRPKLCQTAEEIYILHAVHHQTVKLSPWRNLPFANPIEHQKFQNLADDDKDRFDTDMNMYKLKMGKWRKDEGV